MGYLDNMDRYSVPALENLTKDEMRQMRKEYTRLRDIAQKRIKRLGESEYNWAKAYTSHSSGFKKLAEIEPENFAKEMSQLAKFVNAKLSTVTGQKAKREAIKRSWGEQGLAVTNANYKQVFQIIDAMRKLKVMYGSDKAVSLAEFVSKEGIDINIILEPEKLERLLMHADELQSLKNIADEDNDGDIESDELAVNMDKYLEELGW